MRTTSRTIGCLQSVVALLGLRCLSSTVLAGDAAASTATAAPRAAKIPILYSTDLFHPHVDPDDHYDLAQLFALEEFDIRGIILDNNGRDQQKDSGRPAVEQMMHVTKKKVPYAIGLRRRLQERTDRALDDPAELQGGVELLLKTLRESPGPVTLFTTGSCSDLAVAFNREPALMKAKVKAYYNNAGNGPDGVQREYNTELDRHAYARTFETVLPHYWCPCYGAKGYMTLYRIRSQATVIGACSPAVQNYFMYALTHSKEEPIPYLAGTPRPLPGGGRKMWCTAPMFHAAGRRIYERGPNDYVALSPAAAEKAGLAAKEIKVFEFLPMSAAFDPATTDGKRPLAMTTGTNPDEPTGLVFHICDERYAEVMDSCLKNLLAGLGR